MSDASQVKREDFMENKFTTGLLEHETFSQVQRERRPSDGAAVSSTLSNLAASDGLGPQQIPGHGQCM